MTELIGECEVKSDWLKYWDMKTIWISISVIKALDSFFDLHVIVVSFGYFLSRYSCEQ